MCLIFFFDELCIKNQFFYMDLYKKLNETIYMNFLNQLFSFEKF